MGIKVAGQPSDGTAVLQMRIRKFSEPDHSIISAGRVLNTDDPRASLIAEISETQLPRILVFTNDRSDTFKCMAGTGRVVGIELSDSSGRHYMEKMPRLPDGMKPAVLMQVAQAIFKFLHEIESLTVRSGRPNDGVEGHQGGLCPNALFNLLDTCEDVKIPEVSPLVTFTEKCRSIVDALVVMEEGEFPILHGEANLVEAMKAQAIAEHSNLERKEGPRSDETSPTACAIYSGHPVGGRSVFCATQSGALVLVSS